MEIDEKKIQEILEFLRVSTDKKEKVKLEDLEKLYLTERGGLSERTIANYHWTFKRMREKREYWFESPGEVNEYFSSLNSLSSESLRMMFGCIRAISRYMNKVHGWYDVVEKADRPLVKHKQRRYFKDYELKAIIGACKDLEEKILIASLLGSTCRIGELAGLELNDLGADGFKVTGKTGERWYRCDPRIIQVMREIAVDGIVFPKKDNSRNIVRPAEHTKAYNLGDRVRLIFERAGLKGNKLGPHTLRHTSASIVAKNTRSALAVMALLQHDDIKTSMRYIHDAEEEIQREISPMEIAGLKLGEERQLVLENNEKMLEAGTDVGWVDMTDDLLPKINDGLRIRPALSSDDLRVIRESMVTTLRLRGETGTGCKEVQLMRRMLSHVKGR